MALLQELDLDILKIYLRIKTKFTGKGSQQLEHEQDRQTDTHRQTRPNTLPATFGGGGNKTLCK